MIANIAKADNFTSFKYKAKLFENTEGDETNGIPKILNGIQNKHTIFDHIKLKYSKIM